MLQSTGSQRVAHDLATEQEQERCDCEEKNVTAAWRHSTAAQRGGHVLYH